MKRKGKEYKPKELGKRKEDKGEEEEEEVEINRSNPQRNSYYAFHHVGREFMSSIEFSASTFTSNCSGLSLLHHLLFRHRPTPSIQSPPISTAPPLLLVLVNQRKTHFHFTHKSHPFCPLIYIFLYYRDYYYLNLNSLKF